MTFDNISQKKRKLLLPDFSPDKMYVMQPYNNNFIARHIAVTSRILMSTRQPVTYINLNAIAICFSELTTEE